MGADLRLIDLFAGCGGLTSGFASTGRFQPVGAVEIDADAAATYAVNFGEHVHVGDIGAWLKGSMPLAEVVVGGPPCQGFSALGRRDPDDPRSQLWEQYVEVLLRVRPAFFVLENVPQFLNSRQFASFASQAQTGGRLSKWRIEAHVLNAANYGVAQARRRVVVIGRPRRMKELGRPEEAINLGTLGPLLADVDPAVRELHLPESVVTVNRRAVPGAFKMRDLHFTRAVTEMSLERYSAIPPGGNRMDLPDRLKTPCWRRHTTGSGDVMGRLTPGKPSVTIRTEFFKPEKGRYLHPTENRPITHYEAALIQGFPDEFMWCGTKGSIARQIGNAVPPPLAAAVARHVSDRLR
jgi:DNA (cytosine-5)-methyltransferase 1